MQFESYSLLNELQLYKNSSLCFLEEKNPIEDCMQFLEAEPRCFERTTRGHFTGSAWIVSHDLSQALLTHHKKLNKWLQLGGHADGDHNIQRVALKEAHEESGTDQITLFSPAIFDVDIHSIPSACERHYDIIYLLRAAKDAQIAISEESNDLAWIPLDKVHCYTQERSILRKVEKFKEFIRRSPTL